MIARAWHGLLAAAVLAGMVVQVALVARLHAAPHDVTAGVVAGATAPARYLRIISFFTIQSNLLVGFTSAQLALNPRHDGRIWRVVRLDGLVGIAVTGIVYSTVLARMHEPNGWEQITTNTLFHYITPIAAVLGWLLFGPLPRISRTTVLAALIWPAAWFGYTLVRGAVDHWYPYPFVDVASHGYARVVLNAVLVTLVLGAVSAVFWLGDRRLREAP
jgi:predicted secreted protein